MFGVILTVAFSCVAQDAADRHVRSTEPRIVELVEMGVSRSATFGHVIKILNTSDVIVYVEPKLTRPSLGGYLAHHVVARAGYRYLRIAIDTQGAKGRIVPLLAHELQHAVEVAQSPDARNDQSIERSFASRAVPFGCGSTSCQETQAAKDVEDRVTAEMKQAGRVQRTSDDRPWCHA